MSDIEFLRRVLARLKHGPSATSGPATIDNLDQIAAWAERHRGAEGCES